MITVYLKRYNTYMQKKILAAGISLLTICSLILTVAAEDEHPDNAPDIASEYAYLVDTGNGQVIGSLNSEDRMYPASMTKLMTEILAIEALSDKDERIMITPEMTAGLFEANASVAGYQIGDEPTVRDLLYGTALLGPILPQAGKAVFNTIQGIKMSHSVVEMRVPWLVIGGVAFCLFCMAYFGALCGNSDLGVKMLYHW